MQTIQIGKLKTNFSSILEKVEKNGEKFIIEYGEKHKKVAVLSPYNESLLSDSKRKFGLLSGKINIPEDFNDENDGINELFYGDKN